MASLEVGLTNLIESLEAWMSEHRQSPLNGTTSCRICRALVLSENEEGHADWHRQNKLLTGKLVMEGASQEFYGHPEVVEPQ